MHSRDDLNAEVLERRNGSWTRRRTTLVNLCHERDSITGAAIIFLPDTEVFPDHLVSAVAIAFAVPAFTWTKQYRKATGYFDAETTTIPDDEDDGNAKGETSSHATAFRFLFKVPTATAPSASSPSASASALNIEYAWTELGVWTQWRKHHSNVLLCCISDLGKLDLQRSMSDVLLHSQQPPVQIDDDNPFAWHTFLLPHVTQGFHTAVWKCRDLVRTVETTRPHGRRQVNYRMLHELSRHVTHSSETVGMAAEVAQRLGEEAEGLMREENVMGARRAREVRRKVTCQEMLLKCEHERSVALEARLRNEIELAFHVVNQESSTLAYQVADLARADSESVKTISILGLVFLPGTFAIFGMSFFSSSRNGQGEVEWTTAPEFWLYWVVTIPVTLLTIIVWVAWQQLATFEGWKFWKSTDGSRGAERKASQDNAKKGLLG